MDQRICRNINEVFFTNHQTLRKHRALPEVISHKFNPEDKIWFIKAPGRVNLIGEHTDYNMGPVLPCAVDREIVFCLRKNDKKEIRISNVSPDFEPITLSISDPILPYPKGHWGNYVKAGLKGILDILLKSSSPNRQIEGFDAIVSSTLPLAAGMSSSSAMVVATAISFLTVNKLEWEYLELAEICAKAEHFVGTAGGGMDQAASLLGKKNAFLKIDFNPLQVDIIPAPEDLTLVLFHSLVEAQKSHSSRAEYNRRVLECRISVDLFNGYLAGESEHDIEPINYIGEITPQRLNLSNGKLASLVNGFLKELNNSYQLGDISTLLNQSVSELEENYHMILGEDRFATPPGGFKIKGRFRHVYSECRRVEQMISALQQGDMAEMGKLLNASHQSLSQDYEVSTKEIDDLIFILRSLGVPGARLMGAGFGGMVLALIPGNKKEEFIEKMRVSFYQKQSITNTENIIIPCITSDGAAVI